MILCILYLQVLVLNKVDLVPTWVTQKWVAILSTEYPTVALHASIRHPFGKGALINLLRQFGKLHKDNNQISVGLIGYPNVGKSSVINCLRAKKVSKRDTMGLDTLKDLKMLSIIMHYEIIMNFDVFSYSNCFTLR